MQRKENKRYIRHKRVRAKINGTKECPRLSVFRSSQHIYAQLIDDVKGKTLVSFSDEKIKDSKKMDKTQVAKEVGISLAKKALKEKIEKIVFDRGGYKYHGRIKALAEGAREGGLKF